MAILDYEILNKSRLIAGRNIFVGLLGLPSSHYSAYSDPTSQVCKFVQAERMHALPWEQKCQLENLCGYTYKLTTYNHPVLKHFK